MPPATITQTHQPAGRRVTVLDATEWVDCNAEKGGNAAADAAAYRITKFTVTCVAIGSCQRPGAGAAGAGAD